MARVSWKLIGNNSDTRTISIQYTSISQSTFHITIDVNNNALPPTHHVILESWNPSTGIILFSLNGKRLRTMLASSSPKKTHVSFFDAHHYSLEEITSYKKLTDSGTASTRSSNTLCSPLAGKIIKQCVMHAQSVRIGEPLLIIESMKMQNEIRADRDGLIKTISIKEGDVVHTNQVLLYFEPQSSDRAKELK